MLILFCFKPGFWFCVLCIHMCFLWLFLGIFFHFGFFPYFNTVFSLDACWFSNENQKEIHMGERWEVWRNKEFGGITVTILYKKVSLNKWKILSPPHIHTTENGYLKLQDKKCQVTDKGRPTRMSSVHSPETFKARRVGKAIPSSERLHRSRLLDPMKWSIKIEGDRKTFRDFFLSLIEFMTASIYRKYWEKIQFEKYKQI